MSTVGMHILASAPGVRLFTEDPAPGGGGGANWWVWGGLLGAIVVIASAVVSYLAWRDRSRATPEDAAFRGMAKSLRVSRDGVKVVRRLAGLIDAPPVALLVSEAAFVRAVEAAEQTSGGMSLGDKRHALELRHRVFAEA